MFLTRKVFVVETSNISETADQLRGTSSVNNIYLIANVYA